jgi:uncharacterized membrane protein
MPAAFLDAHALDWLNLALRWFHLIAGIMWIGSSFYFMWLDAALEEPSPKRDGIEGELWMTHSGGFYRVEKRLIRPGELPANLHWFKWEATFTWISGILLLGAQYYLTGGVYLLDSTKSGTLTPAAAVGLSVGIIVVSWFVYDLLWVKAGGKAATWVSTALSLVLLAGLAFGLCHFFSGRAAYVHLGAVLGTLMVANVWVRILPAQQQMIDATLRGEQPDYGAGKRAKLRSVHNSYVTLPVIFMMVSNHYPSTYGHALNWVVLLLFVVLGAALRHVMILKVKGAPMGGPYLWAGAAAALSLGALFWMTTPAPRGVASTASAGPAGWVEARGVLERRCVQCHGAHPTDDVFLTPPNGIRFDDPATAKAQAERIRVRVVEQRSMPLANKTEMTDEERDVLDRWARAGAPIE